MKRVLLIDDDQDTQILVAMALKGEYQLGYSHSISETKQILDASSEIDLFIVDLGLPDGDGHQVSQIIRDHKKYQDMPIIILSARKDTLEHVRGYQTGADNYLEKPFSKDELRAIVKARIERVVTNQTVLHCENLSLDLNSARVLIDEQLVNLTPTEFRLLSILLKNIDQLTTRETIFNYIWSEEDVSSDRTIDHHILSLRRKLKKAMIVIKGVYGKGYIFKRAKVG